MPFLDNDEFLLLMDIAVQDHPDATRHSLIPSSRYKHILPEELLMLRSAGIKTTLPFQCIWKEIESTPGQYDWSYFDNYINIATKVGMKTILFTPTFGFPDWFPDEYFARQKDGVHREALSPWNIEAQEKHKEFDIKLRDRYSSNDCLVVFVPFGSGETIFLNKESFYDEYALKSFSKFVGKKDSCPSKNDPFTEDWLKISFLDYILDHQNIMAQNKFKEIYLMLHPAIADMPGLYGNGNKWIEDILVHLSENIHEVKINHIFFTWIQWSHYWAKMLDWKFRFNINQFGGAEYAEGLPTSTPKAIQQRLRGLICAPCYPNIHDHVESWMCDNIVSSINQFKNSQV